MLKIVIELIIGSGVWTLMKCIINAVNPGKLSKIQKVTTVVAAYGVSSLVAKKTSDHVMKEIDEFLPSKKTNKQELEFKERKVA